MTRQDPEGFGPRAGARVAVPAALPRLKGFDHGPAFLRQPYGFISSHCDTMGVDGFRARILLREAYCLRGPEAAALLYGRSGLTRVGTLRLRPRKGGIQSLEGPEHRARKAMFIRLVMDPDRIAALIRAFEAAWRARLRVGAEISVLDHANAALTRAACQWIGLALTERELDRMTRGLAAAGHARGGRATERMLAHTARAIREERIAPPEGSPLDVMSRELPPETAAVELAHILRAVVAVGRYIAFSAKALHEHPMWGDLFRSGNDDYLSDFCEEVRRTAPHFPVTSALTTEEIVWQGATIPAGSWVIFDIHGTNMDARLFPAPERFRPERMLDWQGQDDFFVPQGAGKVERSHRCPGEAATLALMTSAVRMLCRETSYDVPPQDMRVDLRRTPAQPASGVRIRVQRIA